MDKRKSKIIKGLIILFFIIFPFGQLFRGQFNFLGINLVLQPIDLIVGITSFILLIGKFKKPNSFTGLTSIVLILVFSFLVASSAFQFKEVIRGMAYLLR